MFKQSKIIVHRGTNTTTKLRKRNGKQTIKLNKKEKLTIN